MDRFERRARACQERMAPGELLALFPSPNLYYLTGFWSTPGERHLLVFLPETGEPTAVVPALYAEQLRETWIGDLRIWDDGDDPRSAVESALAGHEPGRLLVDPTMHARFTLDLRDAVPDAEFLLAEDLLAESRVRKDETELTALRQAASVADDVVREVRALGSEVIGTTERELAARIEGRLTDNGGEEPAFDTVVAAGPNGARPHHGHGDRTIGAGDPVVLDFGTRVDRYPSDQTRTIVFGGEPPEGFRAAFEAVRAAQEAAVGAAEPGTAAAAVDRAAREVIEDRGFGDEFIHRTGHGVGLEVHEAPYIAADSDATLEPGMVFSVEPGVYREGEFGVRVEDLVVVTDEGCERLNDSPRDWRADG